MKSIFRKIAFVLALAMVVTLFPVMSASAAVKDNKYARKKNATLYVGGDAIGDYEGCWSAQAKTKTWMKEKGYKSSYESSDPSVATVSKYGYVEAVGVGKTTITATFSKKGKADIVESFEVTVKKNAVEVALDKESEEKLNAGLNVGDKLTLKAIMTDADGNSEGITDTVKYYMSSKEEKEIIDINPTTGELTALKDGEATILVRSYQWGYDRETKKNMSRVTFEEKYTVKVNGFTAEATGVKEITVTGTFTKDSKFEVKKGNQDISFTTTVAEDGKSAVLALATKLTKGTYTVSCDKLQTEITAEDEKVVQITVLENGGQVTTSSDRKKIFVHYDVLNQYGESVRRNYEVKWNSSAGGTPEKNDRENGILTFKVTDAITYGTAIILTGVHTATGNVATVTANLTAGLENCVSGVQVAGVTKKNSNELLKELPAGFVEGEYQLVYKMLDRLGYAMEYSDAEAKNLTFTSLSPLLLSAISNVEGADLVEGGVIIDGVQYGAVTLHRGIDTKKGGVAKIQITSTKTGTSTPYELRVVSEQVLDSFQIIAPDNVIAENDGTITLRYEAHDVNGVPVTDFRALYQSLSFSDTHLKLVENNDGSATLRYSVPGVNAAEDVDVPQIYTTTILTTGKSSMVQLNIKAKAKANAVKGYEKNNNILEGASVGVRFVNDWSGNPYLTWYDQYDRAIDGATNRIPAGYYIAVKYTGEMLDFSTSVGVSNGDSSYKYFAASDKIITITAKDLKSENNTILPQTVEFALADETGKIVSGSEKKVVLNVVDIKACSSFYITNEWSGKALNASDQIGFHVTGKLANGGEVAIPNGSKYVKYEIKKGNSNPNIIGTIGQTTASGSAITEITTGSAIKVVPNLSTTQNPNGNTQFSNQSVTNVDGTHPNRFLDIDVTATLYTEEGAIKDYAYTKVQVGIDKKEAVSFTLKDTWNSSQWIKADITDAKAYINATNGTITYDNLLKYLDCSVTNYDNYNGVWEWDWDNNQFKRYTPVQITVSKVTEGTKGINFKDNLMVVQNTVKTEKIPMISNAEIGDTFVAIYEYERAILSIQFTVGADKTAEYSSTADKCPWR